MLTVAVSAHRGDFSLDVRFEAPTPGVVALFGRSGCGKTTVVNLIAGLARADSGSVTLDDMVLLDVGRGIVVAAERRRIGYVFQEARLFPHLTVIGNLDYARRRAAGVPYVDLDTVIGLLDLSKLLERRTHQLSGGERQRVAIGRALLAQPRLLLLDEPLAALDAARRAEVLPYLESLRDQLNIPMVYVTHDFDEVLRLATHVVLLENGSVIGSGEIGAMSLDPNLRSLIGRDQVGAIIDGVVLGVDAVDDLTRVRVGEGELNVPAARFAAGTALRVQLLARDIIVSTEAPRHLSVRNSLAGTITGIQDDLGSDLVTIDIGAAKIMARITRAATRALALRTGMPAWALVKAVSLRAHPFIASATERPPT